MAQTRSWLNHVGPLGSKKKWPCSTSLFDSVHAADWCPGSSGRDLNQREREKPNDASRGREILWRKKFLTLRMSHLTTHLTVTPWNYHSLLDVHLKKIYFSDLFTTNCLGFKGVKNVTNTFLCGTKNGLPATLKRLPKCLSARNCQHVNSAASHGWRGTDTNGTL